MQVAVRRPLKGTLVTLWVHEYFAVFNNKRTKGNRQMDFYQAVEFSTGRDMPVECRLGLSDKELAQIWVKGLYFAPASRIRRARQDLPKDRYIFQKDTAEDWEPSVQYRAELGNCPELVMVTNCTMWHPMSDVLHILPRVVHPVDVQTHRVYVNGRDLHFVCGVMATELFTEPDSMRSVSAMGVLSPKTSCGFALAMTDRKEHCMYPEERLGTLTNLPSSQWDNVDELFQHIHNLMSGGGGFVSGSFCMQWTNACQRFWEVRL
jgi:hypothetical protein